MKYCTGAIKNMYVKKVGISETASKVVTESIVLKKDAPFYWNLLGRLISFEYNTFLPTKSEADPSYLSSLIFTSNRLIAYHSPSALTRNKKGVRWI